MDDFSESREPSWDQSRGYDERSALVAANENMVQLPEPRTNERTGGPRKRRKSGRLWQLPQSSIQEYAKWIEMKPEETQTPGERRFLDRFHRRQLIDQQRMPHETMKQYVARLETKEKITPAELRLIETYYRRRAQRRRRRRDSNPFRGSIIPPAVFWTRESASLKKAPPSSVPTTHPSGSSMSATIANLQERMNKMGLTSDKLLDIPMHDDDIFQFKEP